VGVVFSLWNSRLHLGALEKMNRFEMWAGIGVCAGLVIAVGILSWREEVKIRLLTEALAKYKAIDAAPVVSAAPKPAKVIELREQTAPDGRGT
jgi:hypothetical protein